VTGVAPFVQGQALVAQGSQLQGVLVWGVEPSEETQVSQIPEHMVAAVWRRSSRATSAWCWATSWPMRWGWRGRSDHHGGAQRLHYTRRA
jgi:ABC-type transport system, involved in lipoprotein release, permease component